MCWNCENSFGEECWDDQRNPGSVDFLESWEIDLINEVKTYIQEGEKVDVNSRVAQEFRKAIETDVVKMEVDRRLAMMKEYGEDNWPDGTVFRFPRTFVNSFNAYQYAALKAGNGKWYVTGVDALTHGMSWGEFLTWMVGHPTAYPVGVAQVDVVSGWKIYEGNQA